MGGLRPDQIEEVTQYYLGEDCSQDHPAPAAAQLLMTPHKAVAQVRPGLEAYESAHGPLAFREFEVNPSVFGRYGGYHTSGIIEQSDWILRGSTEHNFVPWKF